MMVRKTNFQEFPVTCFTKNQQKTLIMEKANRKNVIWKGKWIHRVIFLSNNFLCEKTQISSQFFSFPI